MSTCHDGDTRALHSAILTGFIIRLPFSLVSRTGSYHRSVSTSESPSNDVRVAGAWEGTILGTGRPLRGGKLPKHHIRGYGAVLASGAREEPLTLDTNGFCAVPDHSAILLG